MERDGRRSRKRSVVDAGAPRERRTVRNESDEAGTVQRLTQRAGILDHVEMRAQRVGIQGREEQ